MPRISSHGGGCCGARHISGFHGSETVEQIKQLITNSTKQGTSRGMIVEAIVTNEQCRRFEGNLPRVLQEAGFKLVSRFSNPNTSNICNVFHYNKNPRPIKGGRVPFPILETVE